MGDAGNVVASQSDIIPDDGCDAAISGGRAEFACYGVPIDAIAVSANNALGLNSAFDLDTFCHRHVGQRDQGSNCEMFHFDRPLLVLQVNHLLMQDLLR